MRVRVSVRVEVRLSVRVRVRRWVKAGVRGPRARRVPCNEPEHAGLASEGLGLGLNSIESGIG